MTIVFAVGAEVTEIGLEGGKSAIWDIGTGHKFIGGPGAVHWCKG
jgi:hypothetical protein